MPRNPEDFKRSGPLRWEDMTGAQQKGTQQEMSRVGRGTRSNVDKVVETKTRLAETSSSAMGRKKAAMDVNALNEVASSLKDKPITMKGATDRRVAAVGRAVEHAQSTGDALPGAGWYFQHRADIMSGAAGFDPHVAAASAAALSPGKDPKVDEVPAVHALMELHRGNHPITADGVTRNARDIPSAELAGLTSRAASENSAATRAEKSGKTVNRTVTSPMDGLHLAGRAHEASTRKAIEGLRGETAPQDVNDPTSGPKTASYARAIHHSVKGTAEHLDYMGIAHHLAHEDPAQGMMQFSRTSPGQRPGRDSPLSPDHDTAEDTWMQAISSGQPAHVTGSDGRHFSPAKRAVGGPADPNRISKRAAGLDKTQTAQGATHAFNNKATRNAAAALGPVTHNQHGEGIDVPSIMVQEVAWTQFRRDAHSDAPYNRQQAARVQEQRTPKIRPHPTLPGLG